MTESHPSRCGRPTGVVVRSNTYVSIGRWEKPWRGGRCARATKANRLAKLFDTRCRLRRSLRWLRGRVILVIALGLVIS